MYRSQDNTLFAPNAAHRFEAVEYMLRLPLRGSRYRQTLFFWCEVWRHPPGNYARKFKRKATLAKRNQQWHRLGTHAAVAWADMPGTAYEDSA